MATFTLFIHALLLSSLWPVAFVSQADAKSHSMVLHRLKHLRSSDTKPFLSRPDLLAAHALSSSTVNQPVPSEPASIVPTGPATHPILSNSTASNNATHTMANSTGEGLSQPNATTMIDLDTITQRRIVNIISTLTGATNISSW